jgi:hypothetical protein
MKSLLVFTAPVLGCLPCSFNGPAGRTLDLTMPVGPDSCQGDHRAPGTTMLDRPNNPLAIYSYNRQAFPPGYHQTGAISLSGWRQESR